VGEKWLAEERIPESDREKGKKGVRGLSATPVKNATKGQKRERCFIWWLGERGKKKKKKKGSMNYSGLRGAPQQKKGRKRGKEKQE